MTVDAYPPLSSPHHLSPPLSPPVVYSSISIFTITLHNDDMIWAESPTAEEFVAIMKGAYIRNVITILQ